MTDPYKVIHQTDLTLPRAKWNAFMSTWRPKLYREDARWLVIWENYDKTHPMKDKERREARRQHYLGFYKKMCEELLK